MPSSLVLVTGSSGRIGQAVVKELLARGHPVRGFDRVPTPGLADMIVGDLIDPRAVIRAMQGAHCLIHLAATPDDDDFLTQLVPNNIIGVYHVLEAARAAKVQRLILASSGQVVWHQRLRGPLPVGVDVQPTPRYWYAAGKAFLEAAGRAFSESFGMQVIAVRLGWCPRNQGHIDDIRVADWAKDVYLSPADAGRFFACAVEAKLTEPYTLLYATSKPFKTLMYDLEPTKRLLGFEPQQRWPEGIDVVMGAT